MAVNWNVKYTIGEVTNSLNFATQAGVDAAVEAAEYIGATNITVTPLDIPPVPSVSEAEREAFAAEQERYERPDDYNVWEENQIFLDNEGGC